MDSGMKNDDIEKEMETLLRWDNAFHAINVTLWIAVIGAIFYFGEWKGEVDAELSHLEAASVASDINHRADINSLRLERVSDRKEILIELREIRRLLSANGK